MTGEKSPEAAIPIITNVWFLCNNEANIQWAEGQVASFDPANAALWDYARFKATMASRRIVPYGLFSDPSENTILLCGETIYKYDQLGSPPASGLAEHVALWTGADQVTTISQVDIKNGQRVITPLVAPAQLPDLWARAAEHMQANIYPKVHVREQQPSSKKPGAPASGLLQAKVATDSALRPRPMTQNEFIRQWKRDYKGPPLLN